MIKVYTGEAGTADSIPEEIEGIFELFETEFPKQAYRSFQHSIVVRKADEDEDPINIGEYDYIITVIFEY